MRNWNELSMAEKANVMKLAIEGGVYDLDSIRNGYNKFAEGGGINIKDSKKGTFTAAAKKHGMGVQEFASKVLASKDDYSPAMVKKANFARNASKWKHEDGGNLFYSSNKNLYGFGDWLKKGWDWLKNSAQVAAIAENPAVMTAAGQRVNKQGKVEYNHAQDKDVRQLRSNVFTIGEAGLAAPTLVDDMEAVYQAARHPVQTAKAIKKVAQEGVKAIRNHVNHSSRMPIATKSVEEESFIPDFFLKDTKPVTRESVLQDLEKAKAYKESEGYRSLVEDFLRETGEPDIPADVFYSSRHTNVPDIILEKRPSRHLGGYTHSENRISIDPSQTADDVPFHEGLHWQRVGKPEVEKGPDYAAWGKSFDENAPEDVQGALFSRYYNSEIGKRSMRQEDAIKALYKKKIDNIVYPDAPRTSEMRKPEELIAHTFGIGKSLGLQPFQEYPGLSRALNIIEKARKKDSWLWDIKAGGEEQVKDFWKLLTGNYMPTTIGGATITGLTVQKR
jgi:hypothetical protein